MAVITVKELFEKGVHLGHQTYKWHPRMKNYIYGKQAGIHIIDLVQTLQKLEEAYNYVNELSANGGKILFVGTKFQAREIIFEEAQRSKNFFVNHRWLGGMLSNLNTVKQSISKMQKLTALAGENGEYDGILKKEAILYDKQRKKLTNVLAGIQHMRRLPSALFIVDIIQEHIAVQEAKKLGIPIIALVDTNCDPKDIDFPIPSNDDSVFSISYITSIISSAAIQGRAIYELQAQKEASAKDNKNTAASAKPKATEAKPVTNEKPATEEAKQETNTTSEVAKS